MNQNPTMRKPLEIWQAIIATCLLLGSVVTIIANQSSRIATQAVEIINLEKTSEQTDRQFDRVNANLEKMDSRLTDILVEMQNKKDRDK